VRKKNITNYKQKIKYTELKWKYSSGSLCSWKRWWKDDDKGEVYFFVEVD